MPRPRLQRPCPRIGERQQHSTRSTPCSAPRPPRHRRLSGPGGQCPPAGRPGRPQRAATAAGNLQSQAGYSMADSLLNQQGLALQGQGISPRPGPSPSSRPSSSRRTRSTQQLLANTTAGRYRRASTSARRSSSPPSSTASPSRAWPPAEEPQLPASPRPAGGGGTGRGARSIEYRGRAHAQGHPQGAVRLQHRDADQPGPAGRPLRAGRPAGLPATGRPEPLTQQSDFIQQQLGQLGQQSQASASRARRRSTPTSSPSWASSPSSRVLSAQQAQSQLSYGLGQLGIQSLSDVSGYIGQAGQAEGNAAAGVTAAIGQAGAATGYGAQQAISAFNPAAVGR